MRLWTLRANGHVFSSNPLNFDTQLIQRGNCGGPGPTWLICLTITCVSPSVQLCSMHGDDYIADILQS